MWKQQTVPEMEINYLGNIPHVFIIKNFYSNDEVQQIWTELESVQQLDPMEARRVGGAESEYGSLKKATGKWLYVDKHFDNLLYKISQKIKNNVEVFKEYDEYYSKLDDCVYNELISYYANGGFYKPHCDSSYITACTYFFKEPKKFSGGELLVKQRSPNEPQNPTKFDVEVKIENNMLVMFPGHYLHQAKLVKMKTNDEGYGRYCVSQFFNIPK